MRIKVGLIGFGRMGRCYLKEMQKSGRWDVLYICDVDADSRELAKRLSPESKMSHDSGIGAGRRARIRERRKNMKNGYGLLPK